MSRREEIAERLGAVRERIAAACADAGRTPEEVTLIVVTKFHPPGDIGHLVDLGVTDIGENRDQEAAPKISGLDPALRSRLTCHFIGQLQTNKARSVARYADSVQSVDRVRLVNALEKAAAGRVAEGGTPLGVSLQVDLGEGADAGRGGVLPAGLPELARAVQDAEHLRLEGVMAVAPLGLDEAGTAAAFARLAQASATVREIAPEARWVSGGMSADLEVAVRHGATHLRVGTAILGSRPTPR